MFDELYSSMVKRADYRVLMAIPPIVSILLLLFIWIHGIPMGMDFRGGTRMEITTPGEVPSGDLHSMESRLIAAGLENLIVDSGAEVGTNIYKTSIETTSKVNEEQIKPILKDYFGELQEVDTATARLSKEPPLDMADKLKSRIADIDVEFNKNSSILEISATEIDSEKLESALKYYLGEDIHLTLQPRNYNSGWVDPTLGSKFRDQGLHALLYAYLLIIVVVFIAFRDFVPSIAVILAATFDGLIAAGGMAIFGITLEPASLVAILMLVGYSVDTDILLTTRVLRGKFGTINERIDNAMKTGLTMSMTTILVMIVIIVMSDKVFQIPTLSSIASVLLMGLIGDLSTTWFMNAGILKWYAGEKRGKFRFLKRGRK